MLKSATIPIKKSTADKLQRILDMEKINFQEENIEEDAVLAVFAANFTDNYKVIIEVCTGQNNAYTNPVLYDPDGFEVYVLEADFDLIGEYWFEIGNDTYIVELTNK